MFVRLCSRADSVRKPVADPFIAFNRPAALVRYFPQLAKGQQDQPAVNERTVSITMI